MKSYSKTNRRNFVKKTTLIGGASSMAGHYVLAMSNHLDKKENPIPKWKGFNVLDFFSPNPRRSRRGTTEQDLQWMADWGFDFLRIPMAYPSYLDNDRNKDISNMPELKYPGKVNVDVTTRRHMKSFWPGLVMCSTSLVRTGLDWSSGISGAALEYWILAAWMWNTKTGMGTNWITNSWI